MSQEKATKKKVDTAALLNAGETLDDAALRLTKSVMKLGEQIDTLTENRSKANKDLRHIKDKILTRDLQAKAK